MSVRTTLLLLSASCCFTLSAQTAQDYANTITVEDLKRHLNEISSDSYSGRETGYEGQRKCERYMVDFYKTIGLPEVQGTYVQEFELDLNNPRAVEISKGEETFRFIEDYYYYPGTGDRQISGELVYSGYGITDKKYTDLNIFDLDGKIVMVWEGEPKREDGSYKISRTTENSEWGKDATKKRQTCEEAGALALLVIKKDYAEKKTKLEKHFSHDTMSLSGEGAKTDQGMPVLHISENMAERLMGEKSYKRAQKELVKLDVSAIGAGRVDIKFERKKERLKSTNVMGFIEGGEKKEEIVVITAHYDHIGTEGVEVYNGADDDGSGTVTCMEIAEAFAKAKADGNGPKRSVLILNVSAEEKGLLGSQYYVENPIFPLENTVACLNIDMIGRVDEHHPEETDYVYLIGSDFLSDDLHEVNVFVSENHSNLRLDLRYNSIDDPNRFYYRSDHYNFAKNNVPSVFYFTGVHEDYHKTTDTVDKIMFDKLGKVAKHIFYSAWEIANRDERLKLNSD